MEQEGYKLVKTIENFYIKYNRLPEERDVIHFENEYDFGPFYEKTSDTAYNVYFSIGFDEYYIYDSKIQEWDYFPQQNGISGIIVKIRNAFKNRGM